MNLKEYQEICSKENVFRVFDLEQTLTYLHREHAQQASLVSSAMMSGKVKKPDGHSGRESDDFCVVTCTFDDADAIVGILLDAEASSVPESGETTVVTGRLVDLVNQWSSFRETLLWLNA